MTPAGTIALAQKAVEAVEAALAEVRNRIAPFRRALYDTREAVRARCVRCDHGRCTITDWCPPSKDDVAEIDAAAARFREQTEHLIPEEKRLKAALQEAKFKLRDAEYTEAKAARDAMRATRKGAENDQLKLL